MADLNDDVSDREITYAPFPTSAKPVFIRLGLLVLLISSIVIFLLLEGQEPVEELEPVDPFSNETDLGLGDYE